MKYPFKHSVYTRNILTLMSGTLIAQLVAILVMPLLTRLYLPQHFGIFASYISMISILSILASLRYENAILQPIDNVEAIDIVYSALIITAMFSLVILTIVYLFDALILDLIKEKKINRSNLLLLPVGILIVSLQNILYQWMNRKKNYKEIGFLRLYQAICIAFFSIIFGSLQLLDDGLIFGYLLGFLISLVWFGKNYFPKPNNSFKGIFEVINKYIKYPALDLPASLLNVLSNYLPVILITTYMGSTSGGVYFLVERILKVPTSIVSSSIGVVFRQEAISERVRFGEFESLFKRTAKKLILVGLLIFVSIFFSAPFLFVFTFGSDWLQAGEFAQILSPMFFMAFVASPLSYSFYVSNKLKYDLIGQAIYLLGILGVIFIGFKNDSIYISVIGISVVGTAVYLGYFLASYHFSKSK